MALKGLTSDPSYWEGEYIKFIFEGDSPSGKTHKWTVLSKHEDYLGEVRWFSSWRKYSFFPADDCVFEWVCLRDIAEFLEERTKEQKIGI